MRAALVLALLTLIAGCVSESGDTRSEEAKRAAGRGITIADPGFPADWPEIALPYGPDHNHKDPTHHDNLSTANFEVVAYNPLYSDYYGTTAGDYFCGDVKERDGKRLAVIESFGSDVAFILVDVTDSANPTKIGELVMDSTHEYDIAMTPDQQFVLLSTWPFDSGPDTVNPPLDVEAPTVRFRDACTGEEKFLMGPEAGLPYTSGVVLVDISNPRNPVVVDFRYFPPTGGHSIQVAEMDGQTLILVSALNFQHQASYYIFMEIREVLGRDTLQILSIYEYIPEEGLPPTGATSLHDGYLQKHPITGEKLAYLAYTGTGLVILNVDDPTMPRLVTQWNDDEQKIRDYDPNGWGLHGVVPTPELWDGKHYTFIGEECGGHPSKAPTCLVGVVDTTDPANPTHVGAWTYPVDVQWSYAYMYSPHYFDLVGRTLFITTYHGGVWAVDVSTPEALATMPTIGAFIPDRESPKPAQNYRSAANQAFLTALSADLTLTPMVMDVNPLSDGNLIVWDNTSGMYVVHFDETNPAPSPPPWPIK